MTNDEMNATLMLQSAIDKVLPNPWITSIQLDWNLRPYILIVDDPEMKCNGPCGSMGYFSIEINTSGKIKYGIRSGHRVRNATPKNCEHFANLIRDKAQHLNQYIANT